MKSCFMFGHANCPEAILPKIKEAIAECYRAGVTAFYVGNRGQFDHLAATAVKEFKQHHEDITLYLLLAYHPAERPFSLSKGFDGSFYPGIEGIPRQFAIVKANQYMVEASDYIICHVNHIGNAKNLLGYAKKRRKGSIPIKNITND